MVDKFSLLSWHSLLVPENELANAVAVDVAVSNPASSEDKKRNQDLFCLNGTVIQSLSDAIVIFDEQFEVLVWNRAAEQLYGWEASETIGRPVDTFLKAHFPNDDQLDISEAIRSEGTWAGEVLQQSRSGHLLPFNTTLVVNGVSEGKQQYVLITRAGETSTRQVEIDSKWHHLFDNLPEPVAISHDSKFIYVNQACASLHGASSKEEMIGMKHLDFVLAPFHNLVENRQKLLNDGVPTESLELRIRRLDGHVRYVRSYGVPVDYDGKRAAQIVIHDVTDEKRALAALERSERRFWALFERAGIGIVMATHDTRLLETNPAFQKMLGYTADELRNMKYEEITHPEDIAIQSQFYRQIHEGKIERYRLEKRYIKKNGKQVWGSLTMAVIRDEGGAVEYLIGMVEDISSRKKAEAELVTARNKVEEMALLKSSFLTNVSHEIRTPLTGIIGFAAILEDELGAENRELVQLIQQSGHRLLQTVNSILDLSMLESGTMQAKPQRLNAVDEVLTQIHFLELKAQEKGLYLKIGHETTDIYANVDRDSLDRILANLISNAIKFTREGGITVSVSAADRDLVLKVADTGIGISESFMPHLFEAFSQESTGMTRSFDGTGLGLTIVQRLVTFLGGRIEVKSNVASGSEFVVTFPNVVLEEGQRYISHQNGENVLVNRLQRPKVLVLEDNRDARRLLEKFLEGGFDASLTGEENMALEMAREKPFDVVLMDINLGGERTGVDALRALRHLSGYEQVPVVALTAYAITGDRERSLSHGFDGYLGKPLTKKDLYDTISRVLDPGP